MGSFYTWKLTLIAGSILLGTMTATAFAANRPTLHVEKVSIAPDSIDSPQWQSAPTATITMYGAGQFTGERIVLDMKGVYTKNGSISLLLSWPDSTENVKGSRWHREGTSWKQDMEHEDRIALAWEGRKVKQFATKGCAVLCHSSSQDSGDWQFHTSRAPMFTDLWVWEAARTAPMGHSGDYMVNDDGRRSDKGTGKPSRNINKFGNGPLYMQNPAMTAVQPGMLMEADKVKIDDTITETPMWMATPFSGDFADISSKSSYADGKWTVMMQRKLNTGSSGDVELNTDKKYNFGVALFNNSEKFNSYNNGPPVKVAFD